MSRSQPKIWRKIQKIGGDIVPGVPAFFHVWVCPVRPTVSFEAAFVTSFDVGTIWDLQIWTFVCCHEFVVGMPGRQRGQKQHTGGFVIEALVNMANRPTCYPHHQCACFICFEFMESFGSCLRINVLNCISGRYRNSMVCRYNVVVKLVCQLGNNLIEINFLKIGSHKSQPARLSNESSEN